MTRSNRKSTSSLILFVVLVLLFCFEKGVTYSFGLSKKKNQKIKYSQDFSRGVIVSKNPIASQLGSKILEQGGNAIDAAITTGYALGVVEPNGSGIGGGGFALVYLADSGQIKAIDFRERAPTRIKNLERADFLAGPTAGGIPGTVKGFEYLRENYGSKERAELIDPVISIAQKGFPINKTLQKGIKRKEKILKKYPASREIYLTSFSKEVPEIGEFLRQLDLAKTLEKIKNEGADSFYFGELADLIVRGVQSYGGIISYQDLEAYQVLERETICGLYRDKYKVCSFPPPSSGAVSLIEALNILENFELGTLEYDSPQKIYYLAEALKFAFSDRIRNLGDPKYNQLNYAHLLSKDYAKTLASEIQRQVKTNTSSHKTRKKRQKIRSRQNSVFLEKRETTHYTVVDKDGNIAAVTLSLNGALGSGFVIPETGILLNNTLNDFSFPSTEKQSTKYNFGLAEGQFNYPESLKSPLSSMSPTIVFDQESQEPVLALGAPGGPTIISAILNVLVNYFDHQMSLEEAISVGRIHHQWQPDHLYYEESLLNQVTKKHLQEKYDYFFPSEENKIWKGFYWSVQAVELDQIKKELRGVSDQRSEQGLFYERTKRNHRSR